MVNVSRVQATPAPVGGWNSRDSIAKMPATDAAVMTNWFPTTTDVGVRPGSASYATGMGSSNAVSTLLVYRPETNSSQKMFATASTSLYDVSSSGAVGAATVTGLTAGHPWQYVNFSTVTASDYLLAVNGTDSLLNYDGATWVSVTGVSARAITGVTTSTLSAIAIYQQRVWFAKVNSSTVYYLPANSMSGAVSAFALGSFLKEGGSIVAITTISVDAGAGPQENIVFISSQGELIVYQGTDPSSANTFALVGVFKVGAPVGGNRCFTKFGGDVLLLTVDGLVPMSKAIISARTTQQIVISDKIRSAITTAITSYGRNTAGWEVGYYPGGPFVYINVPSGTTSITQFVMNTTTHAWCLFSGMNANTFAIFNDLLYFGETGRVLQAWTGTSDAGTNITAELIPAFQYLGSDVTTKELVAVRPLIAWDQSPAQLFIGIDVDFVSTTPTAQLQLPTSSGNVGIWDTGLWDSAVWAGAPTVFKLWFTGGATGFAFAMHLIAVVSTSQIRLEAFDMVYNGGEGIIG